MISVGEALEKVLGAFHPLETETVSLDEGAGRVLSKDMKAQVSNPPADVSAMDGYAVKAGDTPGALTLIGTAAAGAPFAGIVGRGECVRILTGAWVPDGANAVVMQEDVKTDGDQVTLVNAVLKGRHVRPLGGDFSEGQTLLKAGRRLTPRDIALLAAMNIGTPSVHRRPRVAVLSTGDEVMPPGSVLEEGQIPGSNGPALRAMIRDWGGEAFDLGNAPDDEETLPLLVERAKDMDLLVTTGGVSVGDRDLVSAAVDDIIFWRVAMRPGKPILFGRIKGLPLMGLAGNPVSAMVGARLFLKAALEKMQGMEPETVPRPARLGAPLPENGPRQAYLRASLATDQEGRLVATAQDNQDSARVAALAQADALILRLPNAPAAETGQSCALFVL